MGKHIFQANTTAFHIVANLVCDVRGSRRGKCGRGNLESSPFPGYVMTLVTSLWTSVATNVTWLEAQACTDILTCSFIMEILGANY